MEITKFLSKGTGLVLMISVLFLIFIAIGFIIRRSSFKRYLVRLLFPVFFIEMAIGFLIVSVGLSGKLDDAVGPAVIPVLWEIAIILLSLYILVETLLGHDKPDPPWGKIKLVGIFLVFTILYLYLIIYIGYYIATVIYLAVSIYLLNYRDWKVITVLSVSWIAFSYFAFYRLLYVPLPKGILIERIFG